MLLSYFAIGAYLAAALLLMRYFTKDELQHQHYQTTSLLVSFAIITQTLTFTDFWVSDGIVFGLATSASFVAWLVAILLFLSSI